MTWGLRFVFFLEARLVPYKVPLRTARTFGRCGGLLKRHCQTVRGTIVTPWISDHVRQHADHSRLIPAMFFDRGVCFGPAQRKKLTNLFEIVCVLLGVPSRPKTVRLPFGPPIFHPSQIFRGYDGASIDISQQSSILFRIQLLFADPILFTFSLKLVPSADQRLVPDINDGIIDNTDVGIGINNEISVGSTGGMIRKKLQSCLAKRSTTTRVAFFAASSPPSGLTYWTKSPNR